ncbi:MAG: hypothetical protein MUF50_01600 [Planctomycetes bacterium]|jgi:MFS superfamily sulfate permease-like transporter|nr:hypothetical protein [Planctomycetota bacterium]
MFFKKIYNFGDWLEDKVRGKLSHYPIIYAFIGGMGIIIFWRGIWHTFDYIMELFFATGVSLASTSDAYLPWWDGPLSILIGVILLLLTGLFVTSFIGNEIIISGLKQEKKIAEKTKDEIEIELNENAKMKSEVHKINTRLEKLENILKK